MTTDIDILDNTAFDLAFELICSGGEIRPMVLIRANDLTTVLHVPDAETASALLGSATELPEVSAAALVDEAWMLSLQPGEERPEGKISDQPNRIECVIVLIISGTTRYAISHSIQRNSDGTSTLSRSQRQSSEVSGRLVPQLPTAH